jgi:hypothetical protein
MTESVRSQYYFLISSSSSKDGSNRFFDSHNCPLPLIVQKVRSTAAAQHGGDGVDFIQRSSVRQQAKAPEPIRDARIRARQSEGSACCGGEALSLSLTSFC